MVFAVCFLSNSVSAVEVVCNESISISHLTHRELQAIFTMRLRNWSDGQSIKVFVLPDSSPVHIDFAKKIMDMFPYQLRRNWDRLVFSGTGQAPKEVGDLEEMKKQVASTPGAIGYLTTELIDGRIKVVKVDSP